eukprot:CCRYP_013770-RA/>CCRYP_013770-RA protein AED:0.47 eAED:0.67 QI:0/0/0/1/0/0/2/0/95
MAFFCCSMTSVFPCAFAVSSRKDAFLINDVISSFNDLKLPSSSNELANASSRSCCSRRILAFTSRRPLARAKLFAMSESSARLRCILSMLHFLRP